MHLQFCSPTGLYLKFIYNKLKCLSLNAVTADHPKSDEYLSDPRLAAYAVPYGPLVPWYVGQFLCQKFHGVFSVPVDQFLFAS